MPREKPQFKVLLDDDTQGRLYELARDLGFHTPNQLAAVWLNSVSKVDAHNQFAALAAIRRLHARKVLRLPAGPI